MRQKRKKKSTKILQHQTDEKMIESDITPIIEKFPVNINPKPANKIEAGSL